MGISFRIADEPKANRMHVAVIGARGNLGQYVVAELLATGHTEQQIDHVPLANTHVPYHVSDIQIGPDQYSGVTEAVASLRLRAFQDGQVCCMPGSKCG